MDQEKFGKFIREIRKKNNLTQKQLADKYDVTYQAVSKWENGKNMPDTSLIKKMSEDFGITLEEMFEGEIKNKKNNRKMYVVLLLLLVICFLILLLFLNRGDDDFNFKTLSSNCNDFTISGNISYNDKKSSIYITNIKYCGGNDLNKYIDIECSLYEADNNISKKISSYNYQDGEITLEEFLGLVTFTVDDYNKMCREYSDNSLYLLINATDQAGQVISYNIPLSFEYNCDN